MQTRVWESFVLCLLCLCLSTVSQTTFSLSISHWVHTVCLPCLCDKMLLPSQWGKDPWWLTPSNGILLPGRSLSGEKSRCSRESCLRPLFLRQGASFCLSYFGFIHRLITHFWKFLNLSNIKGTTVKAVLNNPSILGRSWNCTKQPGQSCFASIIMSVTFWDNRSTIVNQSWGCRTERTSGSFNIQNRRGSLKTTLLMSHLISDGNHGPSEIGNMLSRTPCSGQWGLLICFCLCPTGNKLPLTESTI